MKYRILCLLDGDYLYTRNIVSLYTRAEIMRFLGPGFDRTKHYAIFSSYEEAYDKLSRELVQTGFKVSMEEYSEVEPIRDPACFEIVEINDNEEL